MKRITNIREELSKPLYKHFLDDLIESIINHPEDFEYVYSLLCDKERNVSWRATWTCEKISEIKPEWFLNKYEELTELLLNSTHDGTKRLLLSIFYNIPIQEDPFPVKLLDFCLSHMLDVKETTGVQALSIKLAYMICLKEPELLYELKMYLENAEPEYYSVGVKTCIRNTLKRLN